MDISVIATPAYFASMGLEHLILRRRAEREGPTAANYTRPDTLASLAMGVGSLAVPLMRTHALRRLVPGRTRLGTAVAGVAVVAAVATTVADRRLRSRAATADGGADPAAGPVADPVAEPDAVERARIVARIGGVTAVVAGGLTTMATAHHLTSATRQWRKGQQRDLGTGPVAWAAALVGWDLIYYLNHRLMHEVRVMWAIHVVHHSSEHYNLSTALRQPVAEAFGVWFPYGVLARLGVRPSLIEQARGLDLVYQFWIHTDTIRTMGRAEAVLNAPSHHRVHHGRNPRYLDRNHGGILIIWDRLFGTFQRELPEDPPVYGLTRNIHTYNPWRIATHEYRDILRDVASSTTWRDRLSFVLRGPGWAYRRHTQRVGDERAAELVTAA